MTVERKSDFLVRLVSALIMVPIVLVLAWLGGYWFSALIILLSVLIYWEWIMMTENSINLMRDGLGAVCILCLLLFVAVNQDLLPLLIAIGIVAVAFVLVKTKVPSAMAVMGVGVASVSSICLLYLRNVEPHGLSLLVFLAFCVWASDCWAYIAGRLIGGPKLLPKVSPNKTWAGFFGGITGTIVIGSAMAYFLFGHDIVVFAVLAGMLSLATQGGDLVESAIKRRYDVKDTSNLIPGHGGVLDRVDGLLLASFVFVLFYVIGLTP